MFAVKRPIVSRNGFSTSTFSKKLFKAFLSLPPAVRQIHTEAVTNEHIAELANRPMHRLTLADLVKHGRPPLTTSSLLSSANFTLSILPTRIAHRIASLRSLPFIVVSNPHITKIHNNYMHSLSTLLPWAEKSINTLDDEIRFTECMADLVRTHADTITVLARGFLEARRYIGKDEVTAYLDEHLRARIGTRLVAEQHIALHMSSQCHNNDPPLSSSAQAKNLAQTDIDSELASYIGVIDTSLCPEQIIRHCEMVVSDICELKYGVRPTITINGDPGYTFAHIPMHLEYIITELLKNAFRATIENSKEREPIEITIAPLPENATPEGKEPPRASAESAYEDECGDLDYRAHTDGTAVEAIRPLSTRTPGVTIRIRDRGGGISPRAYENIWDYSFTTFNDDQAGEAAGGVDAFDAISGSSGGSSIAGLGYGLPLGRAYAEYFGGGIAVQSLYGWGTDVYLSLRGVGRVDGGG